MKGAVGFLAVLWCAGAALAQTDARWVEGTVTRVSDGDTLWLRIEDAAQRKRSKPVKVRLEGIDAPERCQPWGSQATQALKARVLGRKVQVALGGQDDYRRWLGSLWLDGEDVSAWMVREGHAWSYRFRDARPSYLTEERRARAQRKGLFSQADPMQPQVFRRWHGECESSTAAN